MLQKISSSRLEAYASPLMVVGAAVILIVVVAVLAVHNVNREARFTSRMLVEKGALLIRAFEAGSRVGMMRRFDLQTQMQNLAEQIALMPGVRYIALVDASGNALAHSDEQRQGQPFAGGTILDNQPPTQELQWRILADNDQRVFMVYRHFRPLLRGPGEGFGPGDHPVHEPPPPGAVPDPSGELAPPPSDLQPHPPPDPDQRRGMRGHMAEGWARQREMMHQSWQRWCNEMGGAESASNLDGLTICIGLDVAPFEDARRQDVRVTLLLAATLLALGLGGVVALYWAQRLRVSRKMLRDTRAFASEVVTHMPIGCITTDMNGVVTMVNHTAQALLGPTCRLRAGEAFDAPGNLPPTLVRTLAQVLQGQELVEQEMLCETAPPDQAAAPEACVPLSVSGVRIATAAAGEGQGADQGHVGAMLLFRDLRELRRLEAAVRRAEKLAAVGNLAAGVAHEIRNPLSSIKASAAFFGAQFQEGSDAKRMAELMGQEVERLNRAVTQLLEYARPSDISPRPTPLAPLVQRSLDLIRRDARAQGVEVVLETRNAPETVHLDPDRITQVLLNLCINAIQAMEGGGSLLLRLDTAMSGARPMARITVQDNGPGLPLQDVERVFDPYYTTKPRGTGLGLAIVQKIVESHHGEVRVQSAPGAGTTFTVLLPVQASA
jgi:two-component system, NtrC family, sensor histidine kinase HydH